MRTISSPEEGPRLPHPSHARGGTLDGSITSSASRAGGRDTLLLRGASAADAVPYQRRRSDDGAGWGRPAGSGLGAESAVISPAPAWAVPVPPPAPAPRPASGTLPPAAAAARSARPGSSTADTTGLRLGEVYAEQLARLREEARRAGWAAGHAEGVRAAEQVVAAAEQAAEERLSAVQVRWERRLASATAAMGAAADRLDATAAPAVDELRDTILEAVVLLVGDLLGREVATAVSPGLDALRRALTLCPTDAPIVVRLHPDDLTEVPADALAQLPASVTVIGDETIERAGAVAEAGNQRVDAQLTTALQRVLEVLQS